MKQGDQVTGLPVAALCASCGRPVAMNGHLVTVTPTEVYHYGLAILCQACCPSCSKVKLGALRPMAPITPTGRSMDFDEWFAGIPGADAVETPRLAAPTHIKGLDPPQQLALLSDGRETMTRGQAARIFQAVQDLHFNGVVRGVDGVLLAKLAAERAVFTGPKLALARKLVEKYNA